MEVVEPAWLAQGYHIAVTSQGEARSSPSRRSSDVVGSVELHVPQRAGTAGKSFQRDDVAVTGHGKGTHPTAVQQMSDASAPAQMEVVEPAWLSQRDHIAVTGQGEARHSSRQQVPDA